MHMMYLYCDLLWLTNNFLLINFIRLSISIFLEFLHWHWANEDSQLGIVASWPVKQYKQNQITPNHKKTIESTTRVFISSINYILINTCS